MGFFSSALKTLGEASALPGILNRADSLVKDLTGFDPKTIHPTIYKEMSSAVTRLATHYSGQGAKQVTAEEAAIIKLINLCAVCDSVGDENQKQVFVKAIRRIVLSRGDQVRPEVSLTATAEVGS